MEKSMTDTIHLASLIFDFAFWDCFIVFMNDKKEYIYKEVLVRMKQP